jgi:outer membrane protein assembly factor BamB
MTRSFCFAALALALTLTLAEGADWPRFRGPNGSGFVEGKMPDIDPSLKGRCPTSTPPPRCGR